MTEAQIAELERVGSRPRLETDWPPTY